MDYQIIGEPLPVLICDLKCGETILTEAGGMSWMTNNMVMETTSNGGVGKIFGRMLSGEALFQNRYTAQGKDGQIGISTKIPGSIRAYEITPKKSIIVQKGGFLASTTGLELSVHFKKKLTSSFFGGEGFIMQKISGSGTAFIEIDGFAVDYDLEPGEKVIVDTGYLAVMEETCTMDIVSVPGIKNMIFGGEGIFNTVITGPGRVTLQTMPISNLAGSIIPYIPSSSK